MSRAIIGRLSAGLVVAMLVIGLCSILASAQSPAAGRIEITALRRGENVSAHCEGMAMNSDTFQMVELRPANGVLAAEVSPGMYEIAVVLILNENMTEFCEAPPVIMSVTAGNVSRETITFTCVSLENGGSKPVTPAEDPEPDTPSEDSEQVRPPEDEGQVDDMPRDDDYWDDSPWDDSPWDSDENDSHGKPHGSDDESDGEEDDLYPLGEITLRWTATVSATATSDSNDGYTEISKVDTVNAAYSGITTWKVSEGTGDMLDFKELSTNMEWSGSRGCHELMYEHGKILCGNEYKKVTRTTDITWEYSAGEYPAMVTPVVAISTDGWYEVFFQPAIAGTLGMQLSGQNTITAEWCDGSHTETKEFTQEFAITQATDLGFWTIMNAVFSPDFRAQLQGNHNLSRQSDRFSVGGHATYSENNAVFNVSYSLDFVPLIYTIRVVPPVPPEDEIEVVPLVPPED